MSLPDGSKEDLFSRSTHEKLTPLSAYFHKLCTCYNTKASCNYKQYNDCKTKERGEEVECFLHTSPRRKRDLEFILKNDQIEQPYLLKEHFARHKRDALTQQDALKICTTAFEHSIHYETCLQFVPNFSNESLSNCVNDMVMTGNNNLTHLHVETALGQCQAYILLNSTFEKGSPDIASEITSYCQNNCSENGICKGGNCTCYYGYGGSDCSFDTLSPPTITRISDEGLCDTSEETCDDITLYGRYFVENMGTKCHMTRMAMTQTNLISTQRSYTVPLEERTMYEGFCRLYYDSTPAWATFFSFNLSNDNTTFTEMFSVYVYRSQCQIVNNDTGKIYFTLQDGYCYIDGNCIQEGTAKNKNPCLQCVPTLYKFDWSWVCNRTDLITTSEFPTTYGDSDEELSRTLVIIASVFTFTFIGLAVALCIVKKKFNSSNYQVNNPVKPHENKEETIYSTSKHSGDINGKNYF